MSCPLNSDFVKCQENELYLFHYLLEIVLSTYFINNWKETNEAIYQKCLLRCVPGDLDCIGGCLTIYNESINDCPCHANCPDGCPCPDYDCQRTVLILNTKDATNVPVLTNSAGLEDREFHFAIDNDVEVTYSCSITWQNELYVFGGHLKRTQVSKMTSAGMVPTVP